MVISVGWSGTATQLRRRGDPLGAPNIDVRYPGVLIVGAAPTPKSTDALADVPDLPARAHVENVVARRKRGK